MTLLRPVSYRPAGPAGLAAGHASRAAEWVPAAAARSGLGDRAPPVRPRNTSWASGLRSCATGWPSRHGPCHVPIRRSAASCTGRCPPCSGGPGKVTSRCGRSAGMMCWPYCRQRGCPGRCWSRPCGLSSASSRAASWCSSTRLRGSAPRSRPGRSPPRIWTRCALRWTPATLRGRRWRSWPSTRLASTSCAPWG